MTNHKRTAYHHGDLRRVLVQTAIELLDERGAEGFSLREVARRASVAAAAPSHHFANVSGLMTAVAIESFERLLEEFESRLKTDQSPIEQLTALCLAYIDHHRQNPGMASIMFRWDRLDAENEALTSVRQRTRAALRRGVERALPGETPEGKIEDATVAIWTATHGLVVLRLQFRKDISAYVSTYVTAIVRGMS